MSTILKNNTTILLSYKLKILNNAISMLISSSKWKINLSGRFQKFQK